jgi:hypothetical protein
VVVGDPPTAEVRVVANPSAAIARPITGSRSVPVISATAFTWPVFSAMSAITAGSTSSTKVSLMSGKCQPAISWPSGPTVVCGGKPTQSAARTPSQFTRQWVVAWLAAGSKEVICPKTRSNSHEST